MSLSLIKKASIIAQLEIRTMTLEYARIGGINLGQGIRLCQKVYCNAFEYELQ